MYSNVLIRVLIALPILANGCPYYLTISEFSKSVPDADIKMNWDGDCLDGRDSVRFFRQDPNILIDGSEMSITGLFEEKMPGRRNAYVKLKNFSFPKGWNRNDTNITAVSYPKGRCLPYYVASYKGNELLTIECLKMQSNWMSNRTYISQMPLKDLFIPGTHASGAYVSNDTSTKSEFVKNYAITQLFDIWSQLVFGIRYLDLSIGFKSVDKYDTPNADNYWIVNEYMFINQLRPILQDVKRFAKISQEVVILDFSSFPIGFYKHPERHSDLLHLIKQEIGDIAFDSSVSLGTNGEIVPCDHLSVDDIRKHDKNILIIYPVEELPYPERESNILCPAWKRFSAAAMDTSQTLDYMSLLFSKKESSPVQDEGWIFHAVRSLEHSLNSDKMETTDVRASTVNSKVISWLKGPWSFTANVVTMDFFSSTNIIDVAINANLQKAFNRANKDLINFEISSD